MVSVSYPATNKVFWRAVLLTVLIGGRLGSGLWGQRITPPPSPEEPPLIGTFYSVDPDGDRIDDALAVKADAVAEKIRNAATIQKKQMIRAQLDETVKVELIFDRPITQRQIDAFLDLGGEITYVYKAVSYGWNSRVRLSQVEALPVRMGDSLVLVEESKPAVLHMRIATQTGRVRPVWAPGFAGSVSGYDGDNSISIAIIDSGADDSHSDLTGRIAFWHDYTSDTEPNPIDVIQHGSHVAGIAVGTGASLDTNTTLFYTDSGTLAGIPVGDNFNRPIDFPEVATTWNSTATWLGGGIGEFQYEKSDAGMDNWTLLSDTSSTSSPSPLTFSYAFTPLSSTNYTTALLSNGSMTTYAIRNSLTNFSPVGDGFPTLRGVAPGCQWVGAKVFTNAGSSTTDSIGAAVDDMVTKRSTYNIKVINLSLGISGNPGLSPSLRQKINTAAANGILPVISAGNQGPAGEVDDPGRAAMSLTVGATNDINELTEYSSQGFTGPDSTAGQQEDFKPDVLAPGGSNYYSLIMSVDSNDADGKDTGFADVQNNDYYNFKGTSMASPFGTGCAALVIDALQSTSNLTGASWDFASSNDVRLVKMLLCATATETNAPREAGTGSDPILERAANGSGGFPAGKDMYEGYGILNVDAAIEAGTLNYTVGTVGNTILGADVYARRAWARKVNLTAGVIINLLLSVPVTGDYDVHLFSLTPTAFGTPTLLASSTSAGFGYDETINYIPPASGEAAVVVKRVSGEGTFTLNSNNDPIPPIAHSQSVGTQRDTSILIILGTFDDGQPDPPGVLSYIIKNLPSSGTLRDPGAGMITEPNTTLVYNGNQVIYIPSSGYEGMDEFTFQAHDGGTPPYGGLSNSATVSIEVKGGLLSEDFENGLDRFTIDNSWGNGNGLWHLSTDCDSGLDGHSKPTSLYYGQDSICDYNPLMTNEGVVTSDPIDLTNYEAPVELTFNYFLHTENAPSGWDIASIEISENGGEFTVVASNNGEGLELVDQSGSWKTLSVDLSGTAGSLIRIRFHFNTIDNFSNNHPGFYVDDITLTGARKHFPPTASDDEVSVCQDRSEPIVLLASDDGYPGPLTYFIESLPAHGVLEDPGASLITEPNTPLVNHGNVVTYTPDTGYSGWDDFLFRADDGGSAPNGGKSNFATLSIEVIALPPETVMPEPNNGCVDVLLDTSLSWNGGLLMGVQENACSILYDVYFDTENPPQKLICEDLTEPYCEPNVPLSHGTKYYWQVAAKNCCGETYSEVWSFTTESCLGELQLFEEPEFTGGTCNTVSWIVVPDANDYLVECASDPNFNTFESDSSWITETEYTFCDLTSGQKYWYRLKARKIGICESPWSAHQSSRQCGTPGDFEPDCVVGILDLVYLISHWLESGCDDSAGDASDWCFGTDLNKDGEVNLKDVAILAQYWLENLIS